MYIERIFLSFKKRGVKEKRDLKRSEFSYLNFLMGLVSFEEIDRTNEKKEVRGHTLSWESA